MMLKLFILAPSANTDVREQSKANSHQRNNMLPKITTRLVDGGSSLTIAEAYDSHGEILVRFAVETVLLVSGYTVSPTATPAQAQTAGDLLDLQIATKASIEGIAKVMIAVPQNQIAMQDAECTKMCVYERKVNTIALNSYTPSQVQYVN
jgi:hypothetical protein